MDCIFFYGSLRDRELTEVVLGRPVADGDLRSARAPGRATRRIAGEAYPVLVPAPGEAAEGVVLMNASATDLDRLSFFEEAEYGLAPIEVETDEGPVAARHFLATDKPVKTELAWDFSHWQANDRPVAIEAARELMDLYGRIPVEDVDLYWRGIMIRARQRARAKAGTPVLAGLRRDFSADEDVATERMARPYTGFLTIEEYRLRHRRFDGSWSSPVERSAVLWGDAVTVIPYDAAHERVLLIEQFRPAPYARGDRNPWCVEVVAGRIDAEGDAEETARREAREEAGVEIGRLREIGRYYSSSALAAEHMTSFVGEADLEEAGGVHGLAAEHEDIRAMVVSLDEALEAVAAGAVNTAPALASILWLAANREAIRAEWSGRARMAG